MQCVSNIILGIYCHEVAPAAIDSIPYYCCFPITWKLVVTRSTKSCDISISESPQSLAPVVEKSFKFGGMFLQDSFECFGCYLWQIELKLS